MKDVWPYLAAGVAVTLALALIAPAPLVVAAAALTAGIASFFRDPRRTVPRDPALVLSPADGRVVRITHTGEGSAGHCVSIFLSVFNVHVNRSPAEGRVAEVRYTPGAFLAAFKADASDRNEQNLIVLDTPSGAIGVKQIAGFIARRIRCYKRAGDSVSQGEKIGFITFGSRVDLLIPAAARLRVRVGDRVRGGTSVIAEHETSTVARDAPGGIS